MDADNVRGTALPHSSFGDEKCCGVLYAETRGGRAEIHCSECGALNQEAGSIDYRLNILGIRVWEDACQLVAKSGEEWTTIGATMDVAD